MLVAASRPEARGNRATPILRSLVARRAALHFSLDISGSNLYTFNIAVGAQPVATVKENKADEMRSQEAGEEESGEEEVGFLLRQGSEGLAAARPFLFSLRSATPGGHSQLN